MGWYVVGANLLYWGTIWYGQLVFLSRMANFALKIEFSFFKDRIKEHTENFIRLNLFSLLSFTGFSFGDETPRWPAWSPELPANKGGGDHFFSDQRDTGGPL